MSVNLEAVAARIITNFDRQGTRYTPDLSHLERGVPGVIDLLGGTERSITIPCVSVLPALVATYKGYGPAVIGRMLATQGVGASLLLAMNPAMSFTAGAPCGEMTTAQIFKTLIAGFEYGRDPELLKTALPVSSAISSSILSSENEKNWIPARLESLESATSYSIDDIASAENLTIRDDSFGIYSANELPNGNKFDFAYRSGYFSPLLATKKYALHDQLECLLEGVYGSDSLSVGILEQLTNNLPEDKSRLFFRGLQLTIPSLRSFLDNSTVSHTYQWLLDEFKKKGIPSGMDNILTRLNYLPSEPIHYSSDWVSGSTAILQMLRSPNTWYQELLTEIDDQSPDSWALAHFHAFLQIERQGHVQLLPDADPHQIAFKALSALDSFTRDSLAAISPSKAKVDQIARSGVRALIKTLVTSADLDHAAFKGQSSQNISILVQAGLDPKQLPRMNNRHMAEAFNEVLGI